MTRTQEVLAKLAYSANAALLAINELKEVEEQVRQGTACNAAAHRNMVDRHINACTILAQMLHDTKADKL